MSPGTEHDERVAANQQRLRAELRASYDVVVCGAGSSGSVVARRVAENPNVTVLLLEAGGDDVVPEVMDPARWMENLGSERDWGFRARPSGAVGGRSIGMSMGKVLGGGSSINVAVWARGHRTDWDFFAEQSGDPGWSYNAVLDVYRRVEDWQGVADPQRRGSGGPVRVAPLPLRPLGEATVATGSALGWPTYDSWNGAMMEGMTGFGNADTIAQQDGRQSIYRDYVYPWADRPNLTVMTRALVTRVLVERGRAVGIEFLRQGKVTRAAAGSAVVLSLGAINSPKLLMQSGIGDAGHLKALGIRVVQNLPGVGANLQDHPLTLGGVWESPEPMAAVPVHQAGAYLATDPALPGPNIQFSQYEGLLLGVTEAQVGAPPEHCWTVYSGLVRPASRGRVRLTGANPSDPLEIDGGYLSDPADVAALVTAVDQFRDLAATAPLSGWVKREVFPQSTSRSELEQMFRSTASSFWHQSGTNAMGRQQTSVVDGRLAVYGLNGLYIADASVMPRITTGNTMAPCVVIGERAADILRTDHHLA